MGLRGALRILFDRTLASAAQRLQRSLSTELQPERNHVASSTRRSGRLVDNAHEIRRNARHRARSLLSRRRRQKDRAVARRAWREAGRRIRWRYAIRIAII